MIFVMNISLAPNRDIVLERWADHPPLSRAVSVTMAVILSLIMIIGAFGNILVVVVYTKYKSLRTTPNTFVINLTVADLLMCILCFPILITNCFRGHMGSEFVIFFCNFDAFIAALTGFVSIYSMTALAMERCIVITRKIPMTFPSDVHIVYIAIACIWIFCGLVSLLPVVGFGRYVMEGSRLWCTFDYFTHSVLNLVYNISIQLIFFVIPLSIVTFCYVCIYIKVRNHERTYFRKRSSKEFDEVALRRIRRNRKFEKNELKTARAAVVLISMFCVAWLPYSVISWLGLFGDGSGLTPIGVALPALFAKTSTVLNPVLYAFTNRSFQRKVSLLFNHLCVKRNGAIETVFPSNTYACTLLMNKRSCHKTSDISTHL